MICKNLPSIIGFAVLTFSSILTSSAQAQADDGGLPDWSLIHSFLSEGELSAIIWHEGNEKRYYQQGVLINIPSWIWTCGGRQIDYKPTGRRWNFLMLPSHYEGFLRSCNIDPSKIVAEEGAQIIDLGKYSQDFKPLSKKQIEAFIAWGQKWDKQEDWKVVKIPYNPPVWRKVPLRSEILDLTPEQLQELIRSEREKGASDER